MRGRDDELEPPVGLRGFGNVLLWLVAIRSPDLVDAVYRANRVRRLGVYGTVGDRWVPSPPLIAWLLTAATCGIDPASPLSSGEDSAKTMKTMRTLVNQAFSGQPEKFRPEWFETLALQCSFTSADLALAKKSREQILGDDGNTFIVVDPAALREAIQATRRSRPAQESPPAAPAPRPPAGDTSRMVPQQLPAAVPLIGRAAELARLDSLIGKGDLPAAAVVIPAITGTGGVGKTTLAIAWARQVASQFPDGQLYADLRGFSPAGSAADPADVIRGFLEALGLSSRQMPSGLDAQAALYRSLLADRRILVLLDNARDTLQVRPLLPGTSRSLALVTSRNHLPGLVADGAVAIPLDVLTPEEARELLAQRLGAERVAAEPLAVRRIISSCARLPLALAITAGRAAGYPDFPLASFAPEPDEAAERLDDFAAEPATDIRAVFSWSYSALADEAAQMFRLLGVHPGPDITAPAAASLAGVPLDQARNALAVLAHSNLVREHLPGRYAFHDLLRAYARELAGDDDHAAERGEAVRRILDHYLHSTWAASLNADHAQKPIPLAPPRPGVVAEAFTDSQEALVWFKAERAVLLAVAGQAADAGLHSGVLQLAWGLGTFLYRQGHWHDMARVMRAAVESARQLADTQALGRVLGFLAQAHIQTGQFEAARTELLEALALYDEPGGEGRRAAIHVSFARIHDLQGNYREALSHSRESLRLYRAADDQDGEAVALNSVGWYCALLGDFEEAVGYCEQSLDLFRTLGDDQGQANAWDSLGYAHEHLGHHELAIVCFQHALAINRHLGARYSEAEALDHLGDAYRGSGNLAAAKQAWEGAMAILDDLGHPDAEQVRDKMAARQR